MNIARWILALIYTLVITWGVVSVLQPGDEIMLGALAGAILAGVLAVAPGVAAWYNPLDDATKQYINIGLMVFVAGAIFAASCGGFIAVGIVCSVAGILDLIMLLLFGLIGSAGITLTTSFIAKRARAKLYNMSV